MLLFPVWSQSDIETFYLHDHKLQSPRKAQNAGLHPDSLIFM